MSAFDFVPCPLCGCHQHDGICGEVVDQSLVVVTCHCDGVDRTTTEQPDDTHDTQEDR